jgi:hypothetical protein
MTNSKELFDNPPLTPAVLDALMNLLERSFHGQITLIVQNFRLVQIERKENYNPDELLTLDKLKGLNRQPVIKKLAQALDNLEFGQVVIVLKKGRIAQIERIVKERLTDLTGLDGEGI